MSLDETEEVRVEEGERRGRYLFGPAGEEAELTYTKAGDDLRILDHTGVPDRYRGQGIGVRLLERAVADARAGGWKLLPLCPFTAAQFRRHAESWGDVLHHRDSGESP